ncbi:leucine-rich repeat extensin-like protein 5 [Triticum dicoccoides]|uniref:leucine-rich repeat extensin-like protein 5 n=1 Tax=Triticum dicoccoides TaxID=85692 RepID=UPI001890270A|nr:leucine-rich repeat extensin-like protein 5 [Triticum dicoccoides]
MRRTPTTPTHPLPPSQLWIQMESRPQPSVSSWPLHELPLPPGAQAASRPRPRQERIRDTVPRPRTCPAAPSEPPAEAVLRHPMLFFASPHAPKAGNRLPASKFSASTSRAACTLAKPDSQPWSPSSPRRFNSAAAPSSSGARARAQARPRPTSLCRSVRRPWCRDPPLSCPASLCSRAAWVDVVSAPKPLTLRQGTTISSHACAPVLQPSPPHAAGTLAPRGRIQPVPGRRKPPHCLCAPASSLSRSRPPLVFPPRPSL